MDEDELTLSDVHVDPEIQGNVIGNYAGYSLSETRFLIYEDQRNVPSENGETRLSADSTKDEDGDFDVSRSKRPRVDTVFYIEHSLQTRLADVGLQVWQGSLYLCDYLTEQSNVFENKSVLELGAGIGLASIVVARVAKIVFCTDIGNDVLALCAKNAEKNRREYKHDIDEANQSVIKVRELDWTKYTKPVGDGNKQEQNHNVSLDVYKNIDFVIAADVIYDTSLTTAFFGLLDELLDQTEKLKVVISIEKRLNFTVSDLKIACPAYEHFRECLGSLKTDFRAKRLDDATYIPQLFNYTRGKYLELWMIERR